MFSGLYGEFSKLIILILKIFGIVFIASNQLARIGILLKSLPVGGIRTAVFQKELCRIGKVIDYVELILRRCE